MATKAQANSLEKEFIKWRDRDKKESSLAIPDKWEDFARLCSVRSSGTIKTLDPWHFQREIVRLYQERSVIVCKSRQMGLSEVTVNFMLWNAARNPGYLGVCFSQSQKHTSLLARRMKRMIQSLPPELGIRTKTDNIGDCELEGGGRILFRGSRADSARGLESLNCAFFDEYSWLPSPEDKRLFDAIQPAMAMCASDARVFVISTPNGRCGAYWDLLTDGQDIDIEQVCQEISEGNSPPFQHWIDRGGWAKVLIHWREHEIYGRNADTFLQEVHDRQKLSWETIAQEYNLCFSNADTAFFEYSIVQQCIGELFEDSIENAYTLGIDPNFGGSDYCSASLMQFCNSGINVQFPYRKKKMTSEYNINKISEVIREYSIRTVAIEVNGGGIIYYETLKRQFPMVNFIPFRSTSENKAGLLGRLTLELEKKTLRFKAESPFVDELLSFRKKDNKYEAAYGKNDDTVISGGLALLCMEHLGLI